MERKKPTNKEIVAKVEMLTAVNNTICEMVENLSNSLKQYIEFKGDVEDYHEYQKEILDARKKIVKPR